MSIYPRGRTFGQVASLYDAARPRYPPQVWQLLAEAVCGLAGRRVLDLAAGTGIATRELADRGADVVACEPDPDLLAELRRQSPALKAVRGLAEALAFRDCAFDLVTCATAWHWFEMPAATAEVARVLRDSGHIALWWANNRHGDGIDWEDAQSAVYDGWDAEPGSRPVDVSMGVRPEQAAADLRSRGWDVTVDAELQWTRDVTREQHLQTLASHSVVLALGADKQRFLAQVEAALQPWPEMTQRLHGRVVVATPPRGQVVGDVTANHD